MNKHAIVTGASRGIGKAISLYLAQKGYSLVLLSRTEENLTKAKLDIQEKYSNVSIKTVAVDFNRPEQIESTIQRVIDELQQIDLFVNSAGILYAGCVDLPFGKLSELINVNLTSAITACNLVAEKMKQQGFGEIYVIGSATGIAPVRKVAAYSATKAALVNYCESLYQELLSSNVQVCCLCPSVVDTDMTNDGRIENHLKIDPNDIVKTIELVQTLSPAASIPVIPIRCKAIELEKITT